jgi:lysozyme
VRNITSIEDQLRADEGFRAKPYRDTVGKLTIGVGRNLDDDGISPAEASIMLANDIQNAKQKLALTIPWTASLDPVRQAVLINMVFNMGMSGLLQFRNTLKFIQGGYYDMAADEMLKSLWAKQVGDRAERLATQLRTGIWQ